MQKDEIRGEAVKVKWAENDGDAERPQRSEKELRKSKTW